MRFTLAFLFVGVAFAQTAPDAAALLAQSAKQLQRYHSYQLTQDTNMEINMPAMAMPAMTYTTVTQGVNPGRVRTEMKMMGMDGMLMVADGKQTWMYMPLQKQYSKLPADDAIGVEDMLGGMGGMPELGDMKAVGANAKVLRSEVLEVDGQPHDCWVIESRMDQLAQAGAASALQNIVYTSWIDKGLLLTLKTSMSSKTKAGPAAPAADTRMVMTTRSMKFNEELPDSLFVFTPPAGATEVKELFPGMSGAGAGSLDVKNPAPGPQVQPPAKTPTIGDPEAFIPNLRPLDYIEPVYPAAARDQKLKGMVDLLVTIDSTGAVVNAEVMSGNDLFRSAALDAAKQYKFRPVIRNGHPVSAYTQTFVDFYLDSGKPDKPEDLGIDVAAEMKSGQKMQELMAQFPRSPQQILTDFEDQLHGADASERFDALPAMAVQAVEAGALDKASEYANELIAMANQHKSDWDYGNAIYSGNTVLGRIALRQGNVPQARQYLLDSVKMSGSPQLDSFGPDFTLARELAQKGERDAVLQFLTLCKGFWKLDNGRLDAMAAAVRSGETF